MKKKINKMSYILLIIEYDKNHQYTNEYILLAFKKRYFTSNNAYENH